MSQYKKYSFIFLIFTFLFLFGTILITYIVDPCFHYHKPNKSFYYVIDSQRYQNNGILKNFDYDALIIGTSMTENFKTSEFDSLFGVNSVKASFSGGGFQEINDNLKNAIKYNKNLKYVIRALDYSAFFTHKDYKRYDVTYPEYLTDDNLFNDIKYLLNKTMFTTKVFPTFRSFDYKKGSITSFDDAYNWNNYYTFGKDSVLNSFVRSEVVEEEVLVSDSEIKMFQENIDENIVSTIKENPDIEFYYFLTPYSILWWDHIIRTNTLNKHLYGEKMVIESIIDFDNVHLFSFSNDFALTTNLDNYKDVAHYGENVNSYILKNMFEGKYRLTKHNYENYQKQIKEYYLNYNYDEIYK